MKNFRVVDIMIYSVFAVFSIHFWLSENRGTVLINWIYYIAGMTILFFTIAFAAFLLKDDKKEEKK